MEGLRVADVRRVEFLEFPTDPRFRGAERVINIIVQEYAYGGYTKITANENFLIGMSSRVNVYSKFSYKKMTYDLYVGANNWCNHHMGKITDGTYRLMTENGEPYLLTRTETMNAAAFKQNQYPVTFRVSYNTDKVQIRNLFAFTNLGMPTNEYSGALRYSPGVATGYTYEQRNPNRSNSASYSGTYFFSLPSEISIDLSPSFNYTHGNDYTDYITSGQSVIYRHAKEDAYNYRVNLYLRKKIGQRHSVFLGGNVGDHINRINYTGDDVYYDKFHNAFAAAMAGYNFLTHKVSINFDAGLAWENSDINGLINNDMYPFIHLNVRYSPNTKNVFSLYFQYATNSPDISDKSSEVLQENEIMYISGNPYVENSRHTTVNFSYTWLPSNTFGMSAYGRFFGLYDRLLTIYTPYDGRNALLRSYVNNGDYINGELGIAANLKLLDGKLQFYVNPKQSFYKSTGIYSRTYSPFQMLAQASYYLGSFYFQAYYESPQKFMDTSSPRISRNRNFHSVTIGWANSNWNLRLMAANFFNKGWVGSYTMTDSPYYSATQTVEGTSYHARLNLSATYTFGYGKKIQHGNEVGEQSGAGSAILK